MWKHKCSLQAPQHRPAECRQTLWHYSRNLKRPSIAQDTKSWPLAPSSTLDTASAPALPKTRNPGPWTPHSIPSNVDKDVYSIERFPVLKTIIGGIHCIVRTSHQLLHFPYAASFIPAWLNSPLYPLKISDLQRSVQNKYDLKVLRPHLGKPGPWLGGNYLVHLLLKIDQRAQTESAHNRTLMSTSQSRQIQGHANKAGRLENLH